MARNRNTFAKREREIAKKRKAEEKREFRRKKKELASGSVESEDTDIAAPEEEEPEQ
jgi:hypothetical protein